MTFMDVHTHAFHPKIADKVLSQLEAHYGILPVGNGLVEDLLARLDRAGIDQAVVHTAATDAAQVIPANNWALSLQAGYDGRIRAFGTMHPDYPEPEKELARIARKGIKGLKFHNDFQGFPMDDPRLVDILALAGDRFAIMFHVGDRHAPEQNPSCPMKMAALHERFPDLPMIVAHLGGYLHWKWALDCLVGTGVYLDTSSSLAFIDDETLKTIFARHPRERILFGSDYPLFDPADEAWKLQKRLNLTDSELEDILANGARLLG